MKMLWLKTPATFLQDSFSLAEMRDDLCGLLDIKPDNIGVSTANGFALGLQRHMQGRLGFGRFLIAIKRLRPEFDSRPYLYMLLERYGDRDGVDADELMWGLCDDLGINGHHIWTTSAGNLTTTPERAKQLHSRMDEAGRLKDLFEAFLNRQNYSEDLTALIDDFA